MGNGVEPVGSAEIFGIDATGEGGGIEDMSSSDVSRTDVRKVYSEVYGLT